MILSWIKRIVPFFVAFALGLLIASFFITIGLPRMRIKKTSCFDRNFANSERNFDRNYAEQIAKDDAERSRREAINAQNEVFRNRSESCRSKYLAERQARRNAEEMRFEDESFDDAIPMPPAPRSRR